jgi:hypothetical protein
MYVVIVGNVGKVSENASRHLAQQQYDAYVSLSKIGYGRVAGESVFLMENDEIISEHIGVNDESEMDA